ncbi:PAS domain-containing protein [Halomonas sp. AOP13-D3-9]
MKREHPILCANYRQGVVQTHKDIAEQDHIDRRLHNAEAALQDAAEWAQATLNSIGDAVITTDLSCRVTYLNRVAESLTGWLSIDALGKPLAEVLVLVDSHTFLTATNPAQRAMEGNRIVGLAMDCVMIRKDGRKNASCVGCTLSNRSPRTAHYHQYRHQPLS